MDHHLDVRRPEAVLSERDAKGRLQLVALEYVVPADAWTGADPPRLFGQSPA